MCFATASTTDSVHTREASITTDETLISSPSKCENRGAKMGSFGVHPRKGEYLGTVLLPLKCNGFFESKGVLNKSRSSRVLLCSSLMGNLLMMNSWKRYTTDSSALVTMGRSFRVTRGHGYECAGLIDTSDSPYIARYSGNPSSRGCNYCNLWDHKQGHQRELGRRCILRCYRLNKSRHA